ncbi:alpha/beta hydrolase [Mangrovibacterium lignilyticum]|uniref:alpha/beta hydrolase n=1 Tax=Mangrovibacterium lignilyticum TaxID=2668052 RepID=UPI0013D13D4B|nr:alpha/beta hydrolase-fold protein [Mangrovibacterium lignilyticum]
MKQGASRLKSLPLLVAVFFLLFTCSSQQTAFAASERIQQTLFSSEIDDSVKIDIQLPDSYSRFPDQTYPVLYLLDGNFYFDYAAATTQMLSRGIQPFTPEFILVGISSRNRFRDFTATNAKVNNDGTPVESIYQTSGGADRFTLFLTETLRPKIEFNYRSNGFNMLFGHSFAGLYTLDLLLHQKADFNAWLIADPSLWWDNESLFHESPVLLQKDFEPTALFLGYTNSISIPPGIDTTLMADCNHEMATRLQTKSHAFYLETRFYSDCSHGSVVIPTFYDGLCFFFQGYSTNPKQVGFDLNTLLETYESISQKIHFQLIPQQSQLENLVRFFMRTTNTRETARQFLVYWQEQYPGSAGWKIYQQKLANSFN